MIRAEAPGLPGVVLLGPVRGLSREAAELVRALDELDPPHLALGLSEEETASFQEHFVGTRSEPFVPLLTNESVEIRELARFGEVQVPNPSFRATLEWAAARHREVTPVDPTEIEYAEMFGDNVGYTELVRRTLRERRLLRSPPTAANADDFIVKWDAQLNKGGGSRELQRNRELVVAEHLRRLSTQHRSIACVLDRERVTHVLRALATKST